MHCNRGGSYHQLSGHIHYDNTTSVFDTSYELLIDELYTHDVIMRSSESNIYTLANRLYIYERRPSYLNIITMQVI